MLPTSRQLRRKASKQRLEHVEAQDATARLEAAKEGSVADSRAAVGLEETLWLCPIEDRRGLDSTREGMVQGFSLGNYIKLVDYSGRLFRHGKASISVELAGIFERLPCSAQYWQNRMEKLRDGRLLGRFFATTRAKLRKIAERLGMKRLVNLAGWPVRRHGIQSHRIDGGQSHCRRVNVRPLLAHFYDRVIEPRHQLVMSRGQVRSTRAVDGEARCAAALRACIQAHCALSPEAIAGRVE